MDFIAIILMNPNPFYLSYKKSHPDPLYTSTYLDEDIGPYEIRLGINTLYPFFRPVPATQIYYDLNLKSSPPRILSDPSMDLGPEMELFSPEAIIYLYKNSMKSDYIQLMDLLLEGGSKSKSKSKSKIKQLIDLITDSDLPPTTYRFFERKILIHACETKDLELAIYCMEKTEAPRIEAHYENEKFWDEMFSDLSDGPSDKTTSIRPLPTRCDTYIELACEHGF